MTGGGRRGIWDDMPAGGGARPSRWRALMAAQGRAVVMLAACLAALVAVLLVKQGHKAVQARPVPVRFIGGSTVAIRLKGAARADLAVQYLQADGRFSATMLTIVAAGMARGVEYVATAGKCAGGEPRPLAVSSGLPDPATGILALSVDSPAGSADAPMWVKVTGSGGAGLGAVRGPFLLPYRGVAIAPGQALCR